MSMLAGSLDNKRSMALLKDLLEKLLTIDPEKRIVPKLVLEHPFLMEKMF
jgi:serine/threonine protein kinase